MTVRTYSGSCHCGAARFRFESEPIMKGCRCNCSICRRRGAVMSDVYFMPQSVTIEGGEHLVVYRWGDHVMDHCFCKTCGIYLFAEVTEPPRRYRVNLGCVDDIDTFALEIRVIDGRSL